MLGNEEIEKRLGVHELTTRGANPTFPKSEELRSAFIDFAKFLDSMTPDGRAKNIMMTHIEEAAMWSNKAVFHDAPLVKR